MANPQADENSWTTFEKLLLIQSVYKHGDNWLAISRTLKHHPMVSHTPEFFTVKNCSNKYNSLVEPLKYEAEIEDEHKKRSGEYVNDKQRMPWTAKLARQLYHERIVELKSDIMSSEKRFRDLVNEIDDIKSGKSDNKFAEMIKKRELEVSSTAEASKESTDIISDVNVKIEPPIILPAKIESVTPMDVDTTNDIIEEEIVTEPQIEIKPTNIEMDSSSTTGAMENDVNPSSTLVSVEVNKDVLQPQTPATPLAEPNENLINDSLKEQNVQAVTNVATNIKDNIELPVEGGVDMMDIDDEKSIEKPIIESSIPALESTFETDVSKTEQAKKMVVSPNADSVTAEDTPQTIIGGDVAMDLCEHSVEFLPDGTNDFVENLVSSPTSMEEVDKQETIMSQEQYESESQPSKTTVKEEKEDKETVKGKGKELEISEVTSKQSVAQTKGETAQEMDIIKSAESSLTVPAAETKINKDDISEEVKDDAADMIIADLPEESEEDKYDSKEKAISTPQAEFKEPLTPGIGLVPTTPIAAVATSPSNAPPSTPGDPAIPPTPTPQYDTAPTPSGETSDDKKLKTWQKLVNMILHEINNHRFASVFQNPIREQDAPGYYDIVKQPMDLKSLKRRLREGTIHDTDSFHRDLMLMFMNASVFNREETDIHQMALEMKDYVETQIMDFRRSEGSGGTHEPATRRKSMAIDANEAVYFTTDRRNEGDRPAVANSSLRGKFKDDTPDHRPTKKTKRLSVSLK
ncbi:hypothetical protein RclHR1_00790039 [Rhizophagus clarus]|uniref:Bromodomain-containing protein n=1 Tax=Rhizophagus clarus TaxID=94130 RepID=A0A2Z6SMF9_9GLOM|nr:hypothetical protein RclHR1_00790039 [Rhizophagus clarus]GES90694.1 bromodomain-containing protein [Rhizophagus clarus]